MSIAPQQYIYWTSALTEKLLTCILTTGCHLNYRKWKDCPEIFLSSPTYLQEIYRKDEEKGVRKLNEKYTAEFKIVCGTMEWRNFNIGNLSAIENGDLVPVEVQMKQIIEKQDAIKMDKDEDRARQARLQSLESYIIFGSTTSVLKRVNWRRVILKIFKRWCLIER